MNPPRFFAPTSQAAASHADSAQFLAGNGNEGHWDASASSQSFLDSQDSEVSRPSHGRRFVVRNVPTDINGLDVLKLFKVCSFIRILLK